MSARLRTGDLLTESGEQNTRHKRTLSYRAARVEASLDLSDKL